MEDTILSFCGRTWLFRAGLGRVILCEEVEGSRHGTGGHRGGADIRQCGPDLGRGNGVRKEDMVGEKILPGKGRKSSLCPDLFSWGPYLLCPAACCTSTNLSNSACPKPDSGTCPQHYTFPLPGMLFFLFISLLVLLPFARRKERSQKEHYLWKAVVRKFQRG